MFRNIPLPPLCRLLPFGNLQFRHFRRESPVYYGGRGETGRRWGQKVECNGDG